MAYLYQPTKVLVTFVDAKETESSTYIRLPHEVSFADAGTFAEVYASALEAASDAKVTNIQIIAEVVCSVGASPLPSSNVHRVGVFIFNTITPGERWILEIPSLRLDLLLTTGLYADIQVDVTTPEISALVASMTTGIGGIAPVAPWSVRGDWGGWNSSGGSFGGGGSGGSFGWGSSEGSFGWGSSEGTGDWGWGSGGLSGGPWGDGGIGDDFSWVGSALVNLLVAYRGIDGSRR